MSKIADVVVVGGGVIGTAITYYLAKKNLKVILVEAGDIAEGTSSKCDGNVLIHDKMPGYDSTLAKLSQDLFPQLAKEIDYELDWSRRGSLLVIESDEEMEVAKELYRKQFEGGFPVRLMDQYEVHDDEPNLAKDIIGGLEFQCDGSLDPMALAFGLIYGAKKLGAEIQTYTKVTGIVTNPKEGVQQVITDKGLIATKRVVNAAGVWAPEIGRMVGLDIPIKPRQGQILVAERSTPVARRKIVEFGYMMAKFEGSNYKRKVSRDIEEYGIAFVFEPTLAGNFLIGSSRRFVGMDITCHIEVLRALAKRATRFFPIMKDINVIRSYSGVRPYTPDHYPIISETKIPGFYVAAGHEGDGVGLSPITGKLIAQMICGEATEINVEPLKLSRFMA